MNKYEKEDWLRVIKELAKMFGYALVWFGAVFLWVLIFFWLSLLFDDPDIAEIIMLSCTVLGVIILFIMQEMEIRKRENKTGHNPSDKKKISLKYSRRYYFLPVIPSSIENSRYKYIIYPFILLLFVGIFVFTGDMMNVIISILILFSIFSSILNYAKLKKLEEEDDTAKNNLYKKYEATENNYNFVTPEQAEREKMQKHRNNAGQYE